MRIKDGFVLRKVMDNYVVVAVGESSKTFRGMIKLNVTAVEIWNGIAAELNRDAIVEALLKKYDADISTVENDVDSTLALLSEQGIIEL